MGTESRLFALAYYLDKPGWESHFREYTNLYQFSPYRSKPSLTYREALFNLEVLEYDMNIRWKTNTARLAIRQPTKSEVREYVLSIGKTNWLRSTRDTNESVFVKQFGINW